MPPLPPHITLEQERNYLKAILKGVADAVRSSRLRSKNCSPELVQKTAGMLSAVRAMEQAGHVVADRTPPLDATLRFSRLPRHVGLIPDGNRRWAEARGAPRRVGYAAGILPGLALLELCRRLGIEEASIYGFTKENVRRPADQVRAFRRACVDFARQAVEAGVALSVIGDAASVAFPAALRPYTERRSKGDIRVNLLVNYGWQWDLAGAPELRSAQASRVDLVVRWGGRRRLSGFLPVQCAYADIYVIETLWPDMRPAEFIDALRWYERQDVTLGG